MFKIHRYPDSPYHELTSSVRVCCHGNRSREEMAVVLRSVVFVLSLIIEEKVNLKLA